MRPALDLAWQDQGACRGPAAAGLDFYPVEREDRWPAESVLARLLCLTCPVRTDCLDHALTNEADGIWGGTSAKTRRHLRRELGITLVDGLPDDLDPPPRTSETPMTEPEPAPTSPRPTA